MISLDEWVAKTGAIKHTTKQTDGSWICNVQWPEAKLYVSKIALNEYHAEQSAFEEVIRILNSWALNGKII